MVADPAAGTPLREDVSCTNSSQRTRQIRGVELCLPGSVMSPSPYTLFLADAAEGRRPSMALDLGCGSGFVAISLARAGADMVVASDLNPLAAACASDNAHRNGVGGRISAVTADMMAPFAPRAFDLILFNPPSLPALDPTGLRPNFYAGEDGRAYIDRFLESYGYFLTSGGSALLVHNSLANLDMSLSMLSDNGHSYRILGSRTLAFRSEYYGHLEHLLELRAHGHADFVLDGDAYTYSISLLELST